MAFDRRDRAKALERARLYMEARIVITPGCWIYKGNLREYDSAYDGEKVWAAHRLSYTVYVGPIPFGKMILHSCDNPGCVNPAHLSPGTALENSNDRWKRPRDTPKKVPKPFGPQFDQQAMDDIRADQRSMWDISREYGLGLITISRIKKGLITTPTVKSAA